MKFINCFPFYWVSFAPLDPDCEPGSRSRDPVDSQHRFFCIKFACCILNSSLSRLFFSAFSLFLKDERQRRLEQQQQLSPPQPQQLSPSHPQLTESLFRTESRNAPVSQEHFDARNDVLKVLGIRTGSAGSACFWAFRIRIH